MNYDLVWKFSDDTERLYKLENRDDQDSSFELIVLKITNLYLIYLI